MAGNATHRATRELQILASDAYMADLRYRIWYFVPHPDQDLTNASPFQGATPGMVATAGLLEEVMIQPADVRELTAQWPHIALFRTAGKITHKVLPIEHSAFAEIVTWPDRFPFRCVISTPDNADFVDQCLLRAKTEWLHASMPATPGRLDLSQLTRRILLDYVKRRLDQLEHERTASDMVEALRGVLSSNIPGTKAISLPANQHNLTRPNEIALRAFGCRMDQGTQSPGNQKRAAQWVVRSADFVRRRRLDLLSTIPNLPSGWVSNAILLTLPATYRGSSRKDYISKIRRTVGREAPLGRLMKMIIDPPAYILEAESSEFTALFGSVIGQVLVSIRQEEQRLYTAVLTRLAAEALIPTLRLIPSANRAWGTLKHLAECARADGPHKSRKLARLLSNAQGFLEEGLNEDFRERLSAIGSEVAGIKLVCDLPLEWLRVDGVPLMLRHECSRVPVVPASLAYAVASHRDPVIIPPSKLTDILVIRSFAHDDPIRRILEDAVQVPSPRDHAEWTVRIRFVDVDTQDQLVAALNDHSGAIVVFDCHGSFEQEDYLSSLVIGGKAIPLWELRKRIHRMPPIVLLSACDTLPVDGYHASVASGMLLIGARAVVGTMVPIDARKAAVFVARLLYRIGDFVPVALRMREHISWREVVSGMTKMAHVTECLISLIAKGVLASEEFNALQMGANVDINSLDPRWYERLIERLATVLGCTPHSASKLLQENAGLTDSMAHVQLGNPELLWLVGTEADRFLTTSTEVPDPA